MVFENVFNMAFRSHYTTLYAFICTVILCILFQVLIFRRTARKNKVKLSFLHYLGVGLFLVYLLIVYRVTGMGTIWDIGRHETLIRWNQIHLIPFHNLQYDLPFLLLNIIMTIPLGFLLPTIWPEFRKLRKVAFTGFCLSMSIELSQLLNSRGTSVDDLLMNTLGAIIGYCIFAFFYKLFHPLTRLEVKYKSNSPIITNEGIFYMFFSFLGMFLFFSPQDLSGLVHVVLGTPLPSYIRGLLSYMGL
jgi:glycopeptide antibiotics resistance protein